ncbi:MAG: polysaccharide biosynthesis tyrosine autokinase [Anaerolineales bacterium]|nr:polysaccharide biosynthesis tyrosine autokinase [Anaerolineales bacterium]
MELKVYIIPLIRFWWLLIVAAVIAAVSSFFFARQLPEIYQTRTTLVVGTTVYETNPGGQDIWLSQQLAGFYSDLARRDMVRQETMSALGLNWLPDYAVRPLPNSQLMEITVTDTNPLRAQAVANELANQLILQTPGGLTQEDAEQHQFILQQLDQLRERILETDEEIAGLREQLLDQVSAREIADTQQEIQLLETRLNTLQTNYASLLASSGQEARNTLTIIESARLPTNPINQNRSMVVLLSTGIAVLIAVAGAYVLNYLDDTLKGKEEIAKFLNLPVLGQFFEVPDGANNGVYVDKQPRSPFAEAFRSLRINLEYMNVDKPLKSILVTSANVDEGKSTVASNLAVSLAQGGKKVILVDADLRKPSIHRKFDIHNGKGLSDMIAGGADIREIITRWNSNLFIIPAGHLPATTTDLLGSPRMAYLLERMKHIADVVIIDSPAFVVPDAAILAPKVDGVIFLVRSGFTRKASANAAMEQLRQISSRMLGVVINRISKSQMVYGGYYSSYQYSPYSEEKGDVSGNGHGTVFNKLSNKWNIIPFASNNKQVTDNDVEETTEVETK